MTLNKALPLVAAVGVALAVSGCATVVRGTSNDIQFTSEPAGATVATSTGPSCVTPCTIKFGRKDEFVATFKLDGHEEQSIPVKVQLGAAGATGMAGNVLIGGLVGVVADAASGATLEHVPNPVHAVMKKLGPQPPAARGRNAPRVQPAPKVEPAPAPAIGPETETES